MLTIVLPEIAFLFATTDSSEWMAAATLTIVTFLLSRTCLTARYKRPLGLRFSASLFSFTM